MAKKPSTGTLQTLSRGRQIWGIGGDIESRGWFSLDRPPQSSRNSSSPEVSDSSLSLLAKRRLWQIKFPLNHCGGNVWYFTHSQDFFLSHIFSPAFTAACGKNGWLLPCCWNRCYLEEKKIPDGVIVTDVTWGALCDITIYGWFPETFCAKIKGFHKNIYQFFMSPKTLNNLKKSPQDIR